VPDEVRERCGQRVAALQEEYQRWQDLAQEYKRQHPELWATWERMCVGELPADLEGRLLRAIPTGSNATRKFSGAVIQAAAEAVPWLVGGSADLAPSNKTMISGSDALQKDTPGGRNIHFGVREHGMGGVLNGMALHGGVLPYGGTFLIFSDYMRPSVRLAAMMGLPLVYVWTHDSVWIGEDGPTHQPVEHLAALRAIPNLHVIRPADANETAVAWRVALERRNGPTGLVLTRQSLPILDRNHLASAENAARGGYVLSDPEEGPPELILIASGSEVHLVLGAREQLARDGVRARVVSMPCWACFEAQPEAYRDEVLPPSLTARLAVEAGSPFGWRRYAGPQGEMMGIERFGASAPYRDLMQSFGFTPGAVVERALKLLERTRGE